MSQRGQRHQAPLSIQQVRRLARLNNALYRREERDKKSNHTHAYTLTHTHTYAYKHTLALLRFGSGGGGGAMPSDRSPVHPNEMRIDRSEATPLAQLLLLVTVVEKRD